MSICANVNNFSSFRTSGAIQGLPARYDGKALRRQSDPALWIPFFTPQYASRRTDG